MSDPISVEHDGVIAVVLIDNPPVNASSQAVRAGLLNAFRTLSVTPGVKGAVLMGAGASFISGSDLREFEGPLAEPQLPEVIAAIEAAPFPVVAAIRGAALGGGYEVALGCDARLIAADGIVGLPEVKLGIIPGAGGTQRLPRIVPVAKAIELICKGTRVRADEAVKLGMVDALIEGDLRTAAVHYARRIPKRVLGIEPALGSPVLETERIAGKMRRAGRGVPAVEAAIASVLRSVETGFSEGTAIEREMFQTLRHSPEAQALRYQFFAEREARHMPLLAGVVPARVTHVGVIGAGTMGAGIAACFLNAGFTVALIERDPVALEAGLGRIRKGYDTQLGLGLIDEVEMTARLSRLGHATDLSFLSDADLVVEAIIEDLAVKQGLFAQLGVIVSDDCVLATNTSYLDIDAIAEAARNSDRVIGLHFFSPADRMRLLELVQGRCSGPTALATGLGVARKLGKAVVLAKSSEGFIGNRIYNAYRVQCEFMVEEGASPEQVDAVLEGFGFAMGPFAVGDLSGLDIAWARRKRLASTRDPAERYCDIADRLCEAGRFGRKTGSGWYDYATGKALPDPETARHIAEARATRRVTPRALSKDEILTRALGAMVDEAALLLSEGVAQRASDVDLAMVAGYGFPAHLGGPLYWAEQLDKQARDALHEGLALVKGSALKGTDPDPVIAVAATEAIRQPIGSETDQVKH